MTLVQHRPIKDDLLPHKAPLPHIRSVREKEDGEKEEKKILKYTFSEAYPSLLIRCSPEFFFPPVDFKWISKHCQYKWSDSTGSEPRS